LYLNQLDAILSETLYGVKLNSQDRNSVSIFDPLYNQTYSNSFIFLDGVPFFCLGDIIGYGSDKVKRIETVNSPWILGDFLFKGILSIFTYNQDIDNFKNEKDSLLFLLDSICLEHNFYFQTTLQMNKETEHQTLGSYYTGILWCD
jgi:hypothetical protein